MNEITELFVNMIERNSQLKEFHTELIELAKDGRRDEMIVKLAGEAEALAESLSAPKVPLTGEELAGHGEFVLNIMGAIDLQQAANAIGQRHFVSHAISTGHRKTEAYREDLRKWTDRVSPEA